MSHTPDIFVSYKREERPIAAELSQTLEDLGYSVYYDIQLQVGGNFADELDSRLRTARLAIVLWSDAAATSEWVRAEARLAKERGIYHPVLIGTPDLPVDLRGGHFVKLDKGYRPKPIVDSVFERLGDPTGEERTELDRTFTRFRREVKNELGTPGSLKIANRMAGMAAMMCSGQMMPTHEVLPSEILNLSNRPDVKDANLAAFGGMHHYRRVILSKAQITDISPLKHMPALQEVFLNETGINNINALKGCKYLAGLHLGGTGVSSLKPLMRCRNLEWLNLRDTNVTDFTPLVGLHKLGGLMLPDKTVIGSMFHSEAGQNIKMVQAFLEDVH